MGMKPTFTCAACHRESPTTGRKAARVLGIRTWVCSPCKTGMHFGKGPKPKPVRDLLLGKIERGNGLQPALLISRFAHERRDEARAQLEKLIGEGVVLCVTRPSATGSQAKRLFTDKAKAERWQAEPDRRSIPTYKPERQGKKLAPVHEQTKGLGWRTHKDQPAKLQGPVQHTVQLMPAFDPRYQCDPKERVIGGFASLGPGRYLDGMA